MTIVRLPEVNRGPMAQMHYDGSISPQKDGSVRTPRMPNGPRTSDARPKRASQSNGFPMRSSAHLLNAAQECDTTRRVERPNGPNHNGPNRKSRRGVERSDSGFLPGFKPTQLELAEEIFTLLDLNKDGAIDSHEWMQFFDVVTQHSPEIAMALNPRAQQNAGEAFDKEEAFASADVDGSKCIDKEEWLGYLKAIVEVIGMRKWKKASRIVFDSLTEMESNGALISPHRVAYRSETIKRNALEWLEPESSDWLRPDGDSMVSFSPMEVSLLKKYFKMRDTDGSGTLDWSELDHVIEDIGRKPPPGTEDHEVFCQLREYADKNKDGVLTFDEFIGFLAAFCHALYERVFFAFDADASGNISTGELESVLRVLAKAGFEVSWDRVTELVARVDDDGNGSLDFAEFCHLMHAYRMIEFEHLKNCSGFPIKRVDGLKHLFDSSDDDGSGSLGAREVAALLEKTSLGRALNTREDLHAFSCLFKRMDRDHSSTLDFEEFLRLLKVWAGGGHVKECDERTLTDTAQKVRYEQFGEAKQAILDGWAEEFEHDMQDASLSEKWGIDEDTVRTIRDCFEFTDVNGSGKIQSSELLPFLDSVGHVVKDGKMKEALDMTIHYLGRDMKEGLDFPEAVELIRTFEKNLSVLALGGVDQHVKPSALLSSLYAIGLFITPKAAGALFEQAQIGVLQEHTHAGSAEEAAGMVDCDAFVRVLRALSSQHMSRWCETCGFKQKDVDKFGMAFTEMLGEFGNADCELKLEKVRELLYKFDLVGDGPAEKSKMLRAITRVDRDNSGTMSFEEFLLLVRNFRNKEMYRHTLENEAAIRKHGLDSESGELLSKAFSEKDTEDAFKITQEDVVGIFKDLGIARKPSEQQKIRDSISVWSKGDTQRLISFPEFLDILKEIEKNGRL